MMRGVKTILTQGLQKYTEHAFGWSKGGNRWIGVHLSAQYKDPFFVLQMGYSIERLRTTVVWKEQQWVMVEYC